MAIKRYSNKTVRKKWLSPTPYYSLIGTCVSILCMGQQVIKGFFIWALLLVWLGYRDEFCCFHMGNFSAVDRDAIKETQPKWWNVSLAVVAVWTLQVLLIKLIRILLKWKYIHLLSMVCCESEVILSKKFSFVSVTRAGVFIPEKFLPSYREISITPGFWYEHIEILANGGVVRRDLGNRSSPVDQAYMESP